MKRIILTLLTAACLGVIADSATADWHTHWDKQALRQARTHSWHAPYYHTQYGRPVPLVVPPTAHMQSRYGWGVTQNTMMPIYHQYRRSWPGPGIDPATHGFNPTPHFPSHTDQFGVYYIRGPW